ncbi:MAG: hypothetical protein HZC42_00385 [Candidatus Eisenbacteria bacterium]|nr:hypothetical protein [Candidatus Eisenbacteria bacterium]
MKRAILALAMLAVASPALALMVEVPLDRLITSSDAVVRAKVTGLESHWTADHSTIVTDVTLSIEESWAGDLAAGAPLVLQVEGGEVGDIGIRSEHQPVFSPGEETVLFLKATSNARLRVNAVEQGKYTVLGDHVVGFRQQAFPLATLRATVNGLTRSRDH